MSKDRYYSSGTKEALFMLSRGYCYEPTCKQRVMRWVRDEWRPNVAVAHICGLHKGSPRYEEEMSPRQRNCFRNLILLCKVHHDQVDGEHTWVDFTVEKLTGWKASREGDLADELDQLDWITQERLQDLMAEAIEETLDKVLRAIDSVSSISKETLEMLKCLVDETLKLPYLDPDDIASLEHCAEVFEVLPDYIPALRESARSLRDVPEYSEILYESARRLTDLADNAEMLLSASRQLVSLGDHAPQLLEAAHIISGQSLWSYESGVREINDAADKIRQSVVSLAGIATYIGDDGHYSQPGVIVAPAGRWSWKAFWWGFSACALFVIAVLALWVYGTAHK